MALQSQNHGFIFENIVRKDIFDLPAEKNNIDKHDIPKEKNKYNKNENCSIKTTCSNTICCGDINRFYNYNFLEKNTIIVIKFEQVEQEKIVKKIYEIDYNAECHKLLFGNLSKKVIENYVKNVKAIPKKNFNYIKEKDKLKKKYTNIIQINPKVDSTQRRVQCSIPNFEINLKDFIRYKSTNKRPNFLRGKKILGRIESNKRKRHRKFK